jgi:hypothetical protein
MSRVIKVAEMEKSIELPDEFARVLPYLPLVAAALVSPDRSVLLAAAHILLAKLALHQQAIALR